MPDPDQAFKQMILAGFGVASAAGLPALLIYWRSKPKPLLPEYAVWKAPWNGQFVLAAFLVSLILTQMVFPVFLGAIGFFSWLYGPAFPNAVTPEMMKDPAGKQDAHLMMLWVQVFGIPATLIVLVLGLRLLGYKVLDLFGIGHGRASATLVLGYLGWLLLTPVVFCIFALSTSIFDLRLDNHPLTDLGKAAGPREWMILAIEAGLLAPLYEELLFRGLLIPWLTPPQPAQDLPDVAIQPRYRAHFIYAIAVVMPMIAKEWESVSIPPPTSVFLICVAPFYWLLPKWKHLQRSTGLVDPAAWRAASASSALFAAFHYSVWPTPIPLFFLALGLAWLALRSRNIGSSVVVHGLFNGVSIVYLSFNWLG